MLLLLFVLRAADRFSVALNMPRRHNLESFAVFVVDVVVVREVFVVVDVVYRADVGMASRRSAGAALGQPPLSTQPKIFNKLSSLACDSRRLVKRSVGLTSPFTLRNSKSPRRTRGSTQKV